MADVGLVKGMARKRERHFNETKTVISVALMLFGACACFCLVLVYPQSYMQQVFNSKLAYSLILDVEDYFTCNDAYRTFVIDEPDEATSMFTVFVFNVSNTDNVLERGDKPTMVETGPYGFRRHTYKYDISFPNPSESTTIQFKEFTLLRPIIDPNACIDMYYRMDRDNQKTNPCADCSCKDYDSLVTIINPAMLKMLHEESSTTIMAYHAAEVFTEIKKVLEDPFTEAVKAHLTSYAWKEIYYFRFNMQAGKLVNISVNSLLQKGYTIDDIVSNTSAKEPACGLASYGFTNCPMRPYNFVVQAKLTDLNNSDYPSIRPFLDSTYNISVLNNEIGMPHILGLIWYLGLAQANSVGEAAYSTISLEDMAVVHNQTADVLARYSFGANYTAQQALGAMRMVTAFVTFINTNFVSVVRPTLLTYINAVLKPLALAEFRDSYDPVPCSPNGRKCVWQYGYLRQYEGMQVMPTNGLISQLIDVTFEITSNPANLYIDSNAPAWYNSYTYCSKALPSHGIELYCANLNYTINDGRITRPAGVWAKDLGMNTDFMSNVTFQFSRQPFATRQKYMYLACNISHLQYNIYRERTDFHDNYVVAYLNKYKDSALNHTYTVGNWDDLGITQFGGGFVTSAIASVRSTNMLVRDGMWMIGKQNYYDNYLEFSSWCVRQGYPQAWINNVADARLLLHSLARRDTVGFDLRKHIAYQGTTFYGDGVNFIRDVGALGDRTFIQEANLNHFNCTGDNEAVCTLLDVFYLSSAAECTYIQEQIYRACRESFRSGNFWIVQDQCSNFETSQTSSSVGIQCDASGVYGNPHPYSKSLGNLVFQMMWSLTVQLELMDGLWCADQEGCEYKDGGLFATTTVRKLLFEGYTEPSLIKYMSLKHELDNIGVECVDQAYDICGNKRYKCVTPGVALTLPNGDKKLLRFGNTSNEEYFAPYFLVTNQSEMLWPFASDAAVVQHAQEVMQASSVNYTKVANPHWAAYPAWLGGEQTFQKHYQCQKRLLSGPPDLFNNCFDTLYTGRDRLNNTLNLKLLHGNDTIYPYGTAGMPVNGSTIKNQHEPYLWPGFLKYRYAYLGMDKGTQFMTMTAPTMFNKLSSMGFTLYQKSLIFQFQRQFLIEMPLKTDLTNTFPTTVLYTTRRYVEDTDTWDPHRALGNSTDSYGMPFNTPLGMASLEKYAGFPIFASTPHFYGTDKWGGIENSLVTGTSYLPESQRTFQDYDPVTGKAFRSALRQQVNIRIEAGPLFPNIISSQTRCVVPTRTFAGSSGYGCFTYVPLFWTEDARTVDTQTFFRLYDHYLTRPERAGLITTCGIAFGVVFMVFGGCLFINEAYHRRKFKSRVYVD